MAAPAQKHEDTERLGMALEYFTAGKYHESLLLFQKLDKSYRLNDRFKAYIGLCYYHEWDFKKAAEYLDKVLPNLSALRRKGMFITMLMRRVISIWAIMKMPYPFTRNRLCCASQPREPMLFTDLASAICSGKTGGQPMNISLPPLPIMNLIAMCPTLRQGASR